MAQNPDLPQNPENAFDPLETLPAPDDNEAWYNRGIALCELKRYEKALASFDKSLEIQPDHDKALNKQGVALVYLGRYEEDLASFHTGN